MLYQHKSMVGNYHNWAEACVGRILRRIGMQCKDGGLGCAVVQVGRRRAVGEMGFGWLCVEVMVYVYRRIYFCFFDILRKRGAASAFCPYMTFL